MGSLPLGNSLPVGDVGIVAHDHADESQSSSEVQTTTVVSPFRTTGRTT